MYCQRKFEGTNKKSKILRKAILLSGKLAEGAKASGSYEDQRGRSELTSLFQRFSFVRLEVEFFMPFGVIL